MVLRVRRLDTREPVPPGPTRKEGFSWAWGHRRAYLRRLSLPGLDLVGNAAIKTYPNRADAA